MGKYSILGLDNEKGAHLPSYTVVPGRNGGPAQVFGSEGEAAPGSQAYILALDTLGGHMPNSGPQHDPQTRTPNMGLNILKAQALVNPNDPAPKSSALSPNAASQPALAPTPNYSKDRGGADLTSFLKPRDPSSASTHIDPAVLLQTPDKPLLPDHKHDEKGDQRKHTDSELNAAPTVSQSPGGHHHKSASPNSGKADVITPSQLQIRKQFSPSTFGA